MAAKLVFFVSIQLKFHLPSPFKSSHIIRYQLYSQIPEMSTAADYFFFAMTDLSLSPTFLVTLLVSKPAAGSVYLETEESRREREWHPQPIMGRWHLQPIMGRWHLQPNMALQAIPRLTELFAADVNDMPKDHHQSSSHKSWGKHLLPLQRTTLHHPPITGYQSPRTLKKRRLL
jgi:hypothetical protein